jgi:tetratricopeptide (TPR) repeat protein
MTGAIIRRVAICAVALGLIAIPHVASAQTGSVKGKVVDAQGSPVDGAQIDILSIDKGGKPLTVKTKKDGTYMQVGLAPGDYKVTVSKGDLTMTQNVHIGLDTTNRDFKLAKAGGAEGVSKEEATKAKAKSEAAQKAFSDGVQLVNDQKYDEAVAKFQEVIAAVPNCPECYANIGTAQANAKKYDDAEAAFKKAIELKPDMADAYNGLANVYNAQHKFDQAQEASGRR